MNSNLFVDYIVALDGEEIPPVTNKLFDYVMAKGGVYMRGKRQGIEICWPVAAGRDDIRGLADLESYMRFDFPKVPALLLNSMLSQSRRARDDSDRPKEILFHLSREAGGLAAMCSGWNLLVPEQTATSTSVRPVHTGAGSSTEYAVIELHSHHGMPAFFSAQDDADESQGFRIYAVIGDIFGRPTIRVRIGMYGHFFPVWAESIFEVPETFVDGMTRDLEEMSTRARRRHA